MLNYAEIIVAVILSVALIMAGYQVYFLPQRLPLRKERVGQVTNFDSRIPFRPEWVWVYSFAYYPFILSPIYVIRDFNQFFVVCLSYFALLFTQVAISYLHPISTPREWRTYSSNTASRRFLHFVQTIDKGGNCFPSMHVAVAVLTTLHLISLGHEHFGLTIYSVWIVPMLISASALYTKQHFVADIIPGFALAIIVYIGYTFFLASWVSHVAAALISWLIS